MSIPSSRITAAILLLVTPTMLLAADGGSAKVELADAPSAVFLRAQSNAVGPAELPPTRRVQAAAEPAGVQVTNGAKHTITLPQPRKATMRAAMPQGGNEADRSAWAVGLAIAAIMGAVWFGVSQATDDDADDPLVDDDD